ncbi:MAG: DnaJ C-terminal domain-containing protein [Hyphomicrobiaceae bacterium]
MDFKDYYAALGVERSAPQDEIKRVYRKLARQFHPDINKEPGAEDRFKEIGEAYEVLGDPEKRAAYDEVGKGHKPGEEFRPPPGWDAGFEFSGASPDGREGAAHDYSDFFEELFRNARRQRGGETHSAQFHARGEDHHARIYIDLKDSCEGATRSISLKSPEVDADGRVGLAQRVLNVTIPKGIEEGQSIRLKGQGSPGLGRMPAGDLYLEVRFREDPLYRVSGKDIYLKLPVAPWEAALGASVKVPTPAGAVMLKVPANSFQGRELRLKGRGLPAKVPGDFYAVLEIVLPPADTEPAREAYRAMQRDLGFDPRAKFGETS